MVRVHMMALEGTLCVGTIKMPGMELVKEFVGDDNELNDEAGLSHLKDIERLANDPEHGFVKPKKPQMIKTQHGIFQSFRS